MKDTLSPKALEAIEKIETILASEGLSPHAGRILGYLMMLEEPIAFSDLADDLSISRGSASQNTAFLEEKGVIQRLKFSKDRRDFFQITEDAGDTLLRRAAERRQSMLQDIEGLLGSGSFSPRQTSRLEGMQDFIRASQKAADTLASELAKTKDRQK